MLVMAQSLTKRSLLRPLPTFFIVGLTVIVAASCVADHDEPLTTSESVAAAPVEEQAAGPEVELLAARALRTAFPDHADRVLGKKFARGFVAADRAFVRPPNESLLMHLDVQLPKDSQEAVRLIAPGGHEIRVRQIGVEGEGELGDRAVAYRRAGGTSFWTVTGGGAEEWLHLEAGTVTSDLDIAAEWEIEGATPVLMNGAVALMDDEGVARAWVTAPEAYGAEGRPVDLRLSVEGQRIELFADARGEEVLLDPGWVAVAPSATGRISPTLTTLANGQALLVGGVAAGNMVPAGAELYNPATNVWTSGGNIAVGRTNHRATLLSNGKVLIAGGNTAGGDTATAELYDPALNTWSSGGSMTGPRRAHVQVLLTNGNVLVAGGFLGGAMSTTVNTAQLYNPTTNTWSNVPNMSAGRAFATGVRLANGRVAVISGLGGMQGAYNVNNNAEIYDPVANTWSVTSLMTAGRYYATSVALTNGNFVVAGGYLASGAATNTTEIYNATNNTWAASGNRTIASGDMGSAVLGTGLWLLVGGDDNTATLYSGSDAYNPGTGTWTSTGNMNSLRSEMGIAELANGDALVAGGATDIGFTIPTNTVDRYSGQSLAAGAACQIGANCASGFCVDGVCCQVAACTATDQCHNPGTCQAGTGTCSNPNKPNGTICNDGNGCTQTDTCQAGACSGANPVVCTALSQCHDPGTCNPGTGTCSNPTKANGSVCNDGNLCTQTDSCQSGACTGTNPITCTALDLCHDVGMCNPATGMCSNPNKADGASCNDNNACTQTDTCQAGTCTGANTVMCTALSQCHDVGICNTATGVCSNPIKTNGAMCNDNNGCTQMDTCQAGTCTGAMPVVCTASDQCHDAGMCNPATGMCSNPNKADGSVCNDNNACTQTDTCSAGTCTGAMPVVCTASDQCHDAGMCDPATGMCSNPNKADGAACDDNDLCTQSDTCNAGACTGAMPIVCTASDQCHDAGSCDPSTGLCSDPAKTDGDACDDGDGCTQADACQAGVCNGAMPVQCAAINECHDVGMCDTSSGMCSNPAKADGTPCTGGVCQSGECMLDGGVGGAGGAGGAGSGGNAGSSAGGSGGSIPTDPGGCSCRVAGSDDSTTSSAFAGLALAAMAMIRRRRATRA